MASLVGIQAQATRPCTFNVRVLLEEQPITATREWKITSTKGFCIRPFRPGKHQQKTGMRSTHDSLSIKHFNGRVYLANHRFSSNALKIEPIEGCIAYNGRQYQGSFIVALDKQRMYLVNQLELEDYVFSVLRWESWPGWPLEVNKAFAIACRSYLISKVFKAKDKNKLYHIKKTNIHQTYNGTHKSNTIKQAIEQTRGLIATYDKKPIDAMFDCCCGGVIPADIVGVDFKKAPYLARTYPCTFCTSCKLYAWTFEISTKQLKAALQKAGHRISTLRNLFVSHKDTAGLIQSVVIKAWPTTIVLSGKELYSLLPSIKSFCYSVEKKQIEDKQLICFRGRGYGHHLGICQWGARNMVQAGWGYRALLRFYYPGTSIMELKNTISPTIN